MKTYSTDLLTGLKGPFVLLCDSDALKNELNNQNGIYNAYKVFLLNGYKMQTEEDAYTEMASTFQFPDYFGRNLDAVDECLSDFEFKDYKGFLVIINDYKSLFGVNNFNVTLLGILNRAGYEWSIGEPTGNDIPDDRQPRPFHTILFDYNKEKITSQLASENFEIGLLM